MKIFKDIINTYCKNKRTLIQHRFTMRIVHINTLSNIYLYNIVLVLKETTSWKSLNKFYDLKPYYYKTINKMHFRWSKLNIYNIIYNKILLRKKYIGQVKMI